MNLYSYKGPVLFFGRLVERNWRGQTYAASEARARYNLMYQYKKRTGRLANAKIELPGKLVVEGE